MAVTKELLLALVSENSVETEDIASVLFTASPDLKVGYPATAARVGLGWTDVPLVSSRKSTCRAGRNGA